MSKGLPLNYQQYKDLGNNNFHLYFIICGNKIYRRKKHFLRFQEQHSELEERLSNDFTKAWKESQNIPYGFERLLDRFRPELYDAYVLMREFVEEDRILFQ